MFDDAEVGTGIVPRTTISAICAARAKALALMAEAAAMLEGGYAKAQEAAAVAKAAHHGQFDAGAKCRLFREGFDPEKQLADFRKRLDIGVWTHLIDFSGMSDMMDKEAKTKLRRDLLGDPPEATEDNVSATLSTLFADAGLIFRRGLANAFSKLDRRFKSHDGFKIGSRMILDRLYNSDGWTNAYTRHDDTLADIERVFAILDKVPPRPGEMWNAISRAKPGYGPKQFEAMSRHFKIRVFKNGNAHLWFTRDDLVTKANLMLAEYYGEVIGDAAPKGTRPDDYKVRSNLPAKDLQFYGTPEAVVEIVLDKLHLRDKLVLEPSAGIGAIVKGALAKGALVDAVEIHPGRADQLAQIPSRLLNVRCANFLNLPPVPNYDYVLMNPPFAGTHWMDHVRHAYDFLNPGGVLKAVLPASAEVNDTPKHHLFRRWAENASKDRGRWMWQELPSESFASVGTRVETVILTICKP